MHSVPYNTPLAITYNKVLLEKNLIKNKAKDHFKNYNSLENFANPKLPVQINS